MQWYLDGESSTWPSIFAAEPVLTGDVVIVLCTPVMKDWARKYLHRSVMVLDSTFGLNKHGYSLFAVMAVGEQGEGVPVCFLITKSETTESITTALKQFVSYLDSDAPDGSTPIRPSTILTDDCQAEQNACSNVFPGAKQALCIFHVRSAIQKTLHHKLKGSPATRSEVYASIEAFVGTLAYMPPCDTLVATEARAQAMLSDFSSKYAPCRSCECEFLHDSD